MRPTGGGGGTDTSPRLADTIRPDRSTPRRSPTPIESIRPRHATCTGFRPVVSPSVGQAHHPGHHRIGGLELHLHDARARRYPHARSIGEPTRRRVVGVHQQRAHPLPAHEPLAVVHPRVVRPQLPAADQLEVAVARLRHAVERTFEPRDVGDECRRRQLDAFVFRAQPLRQARGKRAEIDAVWRLIERRHRQSVGVGSSLDAARQQAARLQPGQSRRSHARRQPRPPRSPRGRRPKRGCAGDCGRRATRRGERGRT